MISFILPTYNEKENIEYMINSIFKYAQDDIEIIVVDDNSPDKTWKIAEEIKDKRVRVIRRMHEKGIASAIYEGIKNAKGDIVSWMDCDRSHHPMYLPSMIEKLNSGYDIVIASRYVKGGKDKRALIRIITSYFFNMYAYLMLGKVKDYDSGFIVMKKKVFDKVEFSTDAYGDYFIEIIYKSIRKGFKVAEVPFINPDRIHGKSKTANNIFTLLKYGIQYGVRVIKIRARF